ncbi:MAG: prepilin-type N-terminal cleavage/methylation domain-containing protein, partial [Victivallales bacterium]
MKRQFFTLVELLLVIAIIAILAGIAIPVVGGMNKKGKETKAR